MKRVKQAFRLTILLAIANIASGQSVASPWPQETRAGILITSLNYFHSSDCLESDCDERSSFDRLDTSTYGEYGLARNLTLIGKFSYGQTWATFRDLQSVNRGVTNAELGVQHTFSRKGGVWSARTIIALPPDENSGVRGAFISDSVDVEAAVLYGANLTTGPNKLFTAIDIGYRKRFGDGADFIRAQSTLGYEIGDRFLLLGDVFADISMRNESLNGADYDVVKLQPSIVFAVTPRWSLQASMTEEIAGRNINTGRTFSIGIWTRF